MAAQNVAVKTVATPLLIGGSSSITLTAQRRPPRCSKASSSGLLAPAVFFLVLALTLQPVGLPAFVIATAAALATQAITMLAMPGDRQPTFAD
jgi:hypothetical protein